MDTQEVPNSEQLEVTVPYDRFHSRTETIKEFQRKSRSIDEGLKHLENFLSFLYNEFEEFGKLRDEFNSRQDECKIVQKDGRIKIKLLGHEKS